MGVYSPVPIVTDEELADMTHMMKVAASRNGSEPFRERLPRRALRRLHAHARGAEVLEYNARFGDPRRR